MSNFEEVLDFFNVFNFNVFTFNVFNRKKNSMNSRYNRRQFLAKSLASTACLPLLNPLSGETGFATDKVPAWVRKARKELPASKDRFFQTAGIAPSPKPVMDEVKRRLDFQNAGPVSPEISTSMSKVEPDLRAHLAKMFGASADEVALTHSTSEGIDIASWALNWQAGDEVIISNQEHPANTIPWYNLRDRFGIGIRRINLDAGTHLLDEVNQQLSSNTRMVSISHVSRNNGRAISTSESAELAELLRSRGIRYHLDGAQGPGCVPFDFRTLGCDYYSTCGHKWLLAPKGTGAFFVRKEMLENTLLTWTGAHSHSTMDELGNYELLPSAARFEFGTRALSDFAGFDAALYWIEELGLDRVLQRIRRLVSYATEQAAQLGFGITSPTQEMQRSGVFVIRLPEGCDGWTIYEKLRANDATYTSPVRHERDLRIAIHFFNTKEEIGYTLNAIQRYCV